jgi:hypothetical protein
MRTGSRGSGHFGFGLSYTRFALEGIRISGTLNVAFAASTARVYAKIANTGERDGQEVVQVNVNALSQVAEKGPVSYPKTLAGFCKISVSAGESRVVTIPIHGSQLSWYDA